MFSEETLQLIRITASFYSINVIFHSLVTDAPLCVAPTSFIILIVLLTSHSQYYLKDLPDRDCGDVIAAWIKLTDHDLFFNSG